MTERHSSTQKRAPLAPFAKIWAGILLFLLVCLAATAGYMAAGWSVEDSLYMVIITIFGVGYGEVKPVDSPGLRALTVTLIISGYAAVLYTVGGLMQMLIDGELNKALGARKMNKEIERLQGHTVVCGFGRMGTILASDLAKAGKPFVVIDSDPLRIKEAEDRDYLVIHGDATEEYVLQHAGTRRASVLATVLSADATNVFITLTAREMNPDVMIIARGENPRTGKKLQSCGADKVVLPTAIGASKIAQLIVRPTAESMLEQVANRAGLNEELGGIGLSFNEIKVAEKSPLVNRPLRDIEVRSNHGFLIVAIRQGDAAPTLNPSGDTVMAAGDVVIVLGHQNDIPSLAEKLASQAKPLIYRGVTLNP